MSATDRLDIADLFARLSHLLDEKRPDDVDQVYTEDAVVHSPRGGALRGRDTLTTFLRESLTSEERTVHLHGDLLIDLDGDEARTSANQLVHFYRDGEPPHQTSALHVTGTAVRTPHGWRFRESRITLAWTS